VSVFKTEGGSKMRASTKKSQFVALFVVFLVMAIGFGSGFGSDEQVMEIWHWQEDWRLGGEDESFIFASISKVLLGHDNNLYILDGRSSKIYVVAVADGKHQRTISISGEGPGELSFSGNMFLMGDEHIGLLRTTPAKIVYIDYQGKPGPSIYLNENPSGMFLSTFAKWQNGILVIAGSNSIPGETWLGQYVEYGEKFRYVNYPLRSLFLEQKLVEEDTYFYSYKPWDLDKDGNLYLAPYWGDKSKNEYHFNVYDTQGKKLREISHEFEPYERSNEEKRLAKASLVGGVEDLKMMESLGGECVVEDIAPNIFDITIHSDGRIWVETSRSAKNQPEGIFKTYDIFLPSGEFSHRVALALPANGEKDIVYFISDDQLIVVKGQKDILSFGAYPDADVLEIICYSLSR